jgi:PBSX family phage terminase large subunit
MILHQNQNIIASDIHRFRVCVNGRRWGKTTLGVEEIKGKALARPNHIAYIAPTYQQARDIAWEMLKKELQPIIISVNESRLELKVKAKKGESIIVLRGWESIETLRGQQFDFIVIDEIAQMRNWLTGWQEVIRPTLTDTKGEVLFISTPKGFNHLYDLYQLENVDSDFRSFHFTSYDNPYLPIEELEKAKLELTEDRFAQEILADFRKTEGLVYKEFDHAKHIYRELPNIRFVETIAGVDPGFTNPCAVATIKVDYDDNYWVDEEYYKTGQTDAYNAEYVASKEFNKVYPDPESPGFIKELTNRKVNVREVIKGKGSVQSGINKVKELFKANRIKINARCDNLIFELETYSYPEKKDAHNEEENPISENDHIVSALRYALTTHRSGQAKAHQYRPGGMNANAFYPIKDDKMAKQFIPRHG